MKTKITLLLLAIALGLVMNAHSCLGHHSHETINLDGHTHHPVR